MSKLVSTWILIVSLCCVSVLAQAPTGIVNGLVTDESGAVIPNATVTITQKETNFSRTAITNAEGQFSAVALPAGDYEVRAEAQGFRTLVRGASVAAGQSTQVNMPMTLGATKEVVTVEAATAQINYENHEIQGVIGRQDIQNLPLNGRSYMQLASIEPGVTIAVGTTSQFNALFTVSVLGGGNRTVFTIDGGNVSDNIDVGGGMSSMNFSQEVVQEFQISTVNFDLATPIAAGGAINVVTRSGSNDFHGSGYMFYRDHNMAAYPNLGRLANDPSPYFVRKNPGGWLGGPIIKNKLFFFFNYEYTNQVQAESIQTTDPAFYGLQGTYGSPYVAKTLSARFDYHINDKNVAFLRYSHDGNAGFNEALINADPSGWAHNTNWADQGIVGLTTTITPTLVNDVRFQYNYWGNHNNQAVSGDCNLPCVAGAGIPTIFTFVGSNFPGVGPNFNAPQGRNTRRYEIVEALSWQKGAHRLKFGGDANPTNSKGEWGFCTPMCVGAFSPTYVEGALKPVIGQAGINAYFPTLPQSLTNDTQTLNLPVLLYPTSIFSGIGVGAISTPAPYGRDSQANFDQFRAYFQDTWKIKSNFTLNYGVAWNAQTGFYNDNLAKPAYLAPIFGTGSNNLGPTVNNTNEWQPAFGFAWSPFKDNKTVIRGGAGLYWDSTPGYYKLREAPVIGPLGDGRSTLAGSTFTNIYPGVINFATGAPIPVGANFPLNGLLNLTVGQFQSLVNQELPAISAKLFPSNVQTSGSYTTTGIDVAKQGVEIYPTHFPLARSYQTSIGIQRDMGHGISVTADWARRQGENVSLGEVDLNHFGYYVNSVETPVIPICTAAQQFVPGQECSTGSITVWTDEGRSVYNGLLVKVVGRINNKFHFQVGYANQREWADQPWNSLNYMAGWGQVLAHQNLNIAGTYDLPWGFEISLNSSMISPTPATALDSALQLPGVNLGSSPYNYEPLPGLPYNCLGVSCSKSQVASAVASFNSTYAGTKDATGRTIAALALPTSYAMPQPIITQDVRVTKVFTYKERYKLYLLADIFNIFNVSNETIGSWQIGPAFGQTTGRIGQTFGQGGPRAFQIGGRISF
jgi:hypothetical protein